ncbi:hypothetical protein [Chitinimonas koreensis]|uniref:hypothetical protein n=1 Tax=Chitinimonas koreensis TaxID=356302 RepID=UPI000407297C|nr:hypothetical protein [Chitinimonas koreensis]QNM96413.1 hypothetical protein H9L41_21935 [Chitinimonas koreensis]
MYDKPENRTAATGEPSIISTIRAWMAQEGTRKATEPTAITALRVQYGELIGRDVFVLERNGVRRGRLDQVRVALNAPELGLPGFRVAYFVAFPPRDGGAPTVSEVGMVFPSAGHAFDALDAITQHSAALTYGDAP